MFGRELIKNAASGPGVYLMRDDADRVLYVGKAKSLKKRLASYPRIDLDGRSKGAMMLAAVVRVETMLTRTEKEALILEAALIKQHRPRYNVILRDDKNYPLLKVTVREEWPRLLMTRRRLTDGARYFGPYSSPSAMWETLALLNSLFPLRRCKSKSFKSGQRACLNHQMGRCPAPCVGRISAADYQASVQAVIKVLEGRSRELVTLLTGRMREAAAELRFEEAARCRDRIKALTGTLERQAVVASRARDQDVFGLACRDGRMAMAVLLVRAGVISDRRTFFLGEPLGDAATVLSEALPLFYDQAPFVPPEIILPLALPDAETQSEWLSEKRQQRVTLLTPRQGNRRRLLEMAIANAEQVLLENEAQAAGWRELAEGLQRALHLSQPPERVECLDISNLGGQEAVGSLVSFRAGEKEPAAYRSFKIRGQQTPDDYAMMAEVLDRHLPRALAEKRLPDLLLIDGGKGHLGVAMAACKRLGLNERPELAAIAKEREEEGEKLFRPGRKNPIILPRHSPLLHFLMRVRDEAHRYGITFHRGLRSRKMLSSRLDQVSGLGPAKKKALLTALGSLRRIEETEVAELAAVPGIGPALAQRIKEHLAVPAE